MAMIIAKHFRQKQQGFTLVEVLMSVALVGIMAAIATPGFLTWLNNRKVEDAFAQVEGAIREAQTEAIKKGLSCTLNLNITGPSPSITSTPSQCLPTGTRDLAKLGVQVLANNETGVSIGTANLGTPATLAFSYRGSFSSPGVGMIVVYQSQGANRRRCLVIASGIGMIRTGIYEGNTPSNPTDAANCRTTS
jgi:prepilin-type N-terminal cleavage/methylation domain-containing protein